MAIIGDIFFKPVIASGEIISILYLGLFLSSLIRVLTSLPPPIKVINSRWPLKTNGKNFFRFGIKEL